MFLPLLRIYASNLTPVDCMERDDEKTKKPDTDTEKDSPWTFEVDGSQLAKFLRSKVRNRKNFAYIKDVLLLRLDDVLLSSGIRVKSLYDVRCRIKCSGGSLLHDVNDLSAENGWFLPRLLELTRAAVMLRLHGKQAWLYC
ncbi:hypothetical protein Tco_1265460 [Tanacetum coccineum]